MELWKQPPVIKLYEALGTIGDGRIEVEGDTAKVWSSSGDKYYDVTYDEAAAAIMANDNGSYWQGYLGYPGIAYLLSRGAVGFDPRLAQCLKGFHWKEINTRFKNDWDRTAQLVRDEMTARHPELDLGWFDAELGRIMQALMALKLTKLGPRARPPRT